MPESGIPVVDPLLDEVELEVVLLPVVEPPVEVVVVPAPPPDVVPVAAVVDAPEVPPPLAVVAVSNPTGGVDDAHPAASRKMNGAARAVIRAAS
jgi:hypothetical protein